VFLSYFFMDAAIFLYIHCLIRCLFFRRMSNPDRSPLSSFEGGAIYSLFSISFHPLRSYGENIILFDVVHLYAHHLNNISILCEKTGRKEYMDVFREYIQSRSEYDFKIFNPTTTCTKINCIPAEPR
jgi:hypothetical protein